MTFLQREIKDMTQVSTQAKLCTLLFGTIAVEVRQASWIYDGNDGLPQHIGWRPWRDQLKISSGFSYCPGIITEPCQAEVH